MPRVDPLTRECQRKNDPDLGYLHDQVIWSPVFRKWLCANCRNNMAERESSKKPGALAQFEDKNG